jgi:hypothetical protein
MKVSKRCRGGGVPGASTQLSRALLTDLARYLLLRAVERRDR